MIQTVFPRCPDCGQPTQLLRDVEETLKGAPRTWWCPRCTTHLRRSGDVWEILDLDPDGRLIRRTTPTAGAHLLRRLQAVAADPQLHPTAKALYVALATRADAQGHVTAALSDLAQWAGCSYTAAYYARTELRQHGWVSWAGAAPARCRYQLSAPFKH